MAKAKKEVVPRYVAPPDPYIYFYVGEKYYKRLLSIPYAYKKPDYKDLKKKFAITKS